MASKVDIWNLALANIGHKAQITDPDEASAEANHCRRFYPIALQATLEQHSWSFATRREQLAEVDNPVSHWSFAYARPNLCVKERAVFLPGTTDDAMEQPFAVESNDDGDIIIYTNTEDAVLKYTRLVEDTTKYSPNFVLALAANLSAMLVGPIPKDAKMKDIMRKEAMYFIAEAQAADMNAGRSDTYRDFEPSHLAARA